MTGAQERLKGTREQLIDSAQDFSDFIGGYLPASAKPFQNRISRPITDLVGGLAGLTGVADKAVGVANWATNATVATVAPNSELARQAGQETSEFIQSTVETLQAIRGVTERGAQMVVEDPLGAAGAAMQMAESGVNKALEHAVALARADPRANASTTAFTTELAAEIVIGAKGAGTARGVLQAAGRQVDDLAGSLARTLGRRASPKKGLPEFLRKRFAAGEDFNRVNRPRYPYNEVEVVDASGKRFRVDSLDPDRGEIVSRRLTQLADVKRGTATSYFNEFTRKYPAGSTITDSPFNPRILRGQQLQGDLLFEVPVQRRPIPRSVLDAAAEKGIVIRDTTGRVY